MLALVLCAPATAQQASGADQQFGGEHAALRPEQQCLVENWFQRFSKAIGKPVNPEEA